MKQKLNRREKNILQILKSKNGEVVSFHDILFDSEINPIKKSMFETFWNDLKVRKRYKAILKNSICQIRKKARVQIENIKNLGYRI